MTVGLSSAEETYTGIQSVKDCFLKGTATLLFSTGWHISQPARTNEIIDHFMKSSWEMDLEGYRSSNATIFSDSDLANVGILRQFAHEFIEGTEDVPGKYEEVFRENYRDMLA